MRNHRLVLLALLAFSPHGGIAAEIRRVEFEGLRRVPVETLRRSVETAPGGGLDPNRLESDLRRLAALGILEHAAVATRDAGGGRVDVVFTVAEAPVLNSFEIWLAPHPGRSETCGLAA